VAGSSEGDRRHGKEVQEVKLGVDMVETLRILIGVAPTTATIRTFPKRDFDRFKVSLLWGGFLLYGD
jgi:hypothetical protein